MDIPRLLEAVGSLAWPTLAAIVIWRGFPFLRQLLQSRGFAVKVGGMELTVQEASDQLRQQVEDLQRKLSEVRQQTQTAAATAPPAPTPTAAVPRRVVWVDDVPANNAYEIARLRDDGVEVIQCMSTEEALQLLLGQRVAARVVVSDMGRKENGVYRPRAGASLIEQLRDAGVTTPVFIYSSARGLDRARDEVFAVGGNGATSSMVELFEMIRGPLELAG